MNPFYMEYFVGGTPKPQGSKKAMIAKNSGRVITKDASDKLAVWRNDVAEATRRNLEKREVEAPMTGAAYLTVGFFYQAPKVLARQYTRTFEKGGYPAIQRRWAHLIGPMGLLFKAYGDDIDKLLRAVCDALMAGGAIKDDKQIVHIVGQKYHALKDGQLRVPGAEIALTVWEET